LADGIKNAGIIGPAAYRKEEEQSEDVLLFLAVIMLQYRFQPDMERQVLF